MLIQAYCSSATHSNNKLSVGTDIASYILLQFSCCWLLDVVALAAGAYVYTPS